VKAAKSKTRPVVHDADAGAGADDDDELDLVSISWLVFTAVLLHLGDWSRMLILQHGRIRRG